jgi:hypothetical protein
MIKMPKAKLPKPMIPVTKVDVIGTLVMLELGQEEYILFRDVKPSTLRTTSSRLKGKIFDISELGLMEWQDNAQALK